MAGWLLQLGRGVFVPMVSAVLVVYVILGVSKLTRRLPGVGAAAPEWLHLLVATVAIAAALFEVVGVFVANLAALAARAPAFQAAFAALIERGATAIGLDGVLAWEALEREALGAINLQRALRTALSSAAGIFGGLFLLLLNLAFLMLERRSFVDKLGRLHADPARAARVLDVAMDVNDRFARYLAIKTLINIALGVLSYGVLVAFGVEFAGFWAIVIGLLNYIPYIGSFVGVAFPVALALVQFPEPETALLLMGALIGAQVLMGNVIEPQVMGQSLNLSPYVILIALTVWSSLWGVAGAIVSVPVTAALVIVLSEFAGARWLAVLLSKDGRLDR
jgi:predicted PurR-regulated permease PerM